MVAIRKVQKVSTQEPTSPSPLHPGIRCPGTKLVLRQYRLVLSL